MINEDELVLTIHSVKHLPKCERCWHHHAEAGIHPLWPSYVLCPRCVGVLLEIKWPPYILRPETENDCYICADEAEWYRIKSGAMQIPEEENHE